MVLDENLSRDWGWEQVVGLNLGNSISPPRAEGKLFYSVCTDLPSSNLRATYKHRPQFSIDQSQNLRVPQPC